MLNYCTCLLLLVFFCCNCRHKEEKTIAQFPGKPEVPLSIKKEHSYLLDKIHTITLFQDSTGRAALKLYELLQHHFAEEEEYVLPPLGLLPLLASGKLPVQKKEVIQLCEQLKSQQPHLSAEHQFIKAFMDELTQAAIKEDHPGVIEFEKELQQHANREEEVFFPTAILVGEYLKLTTP